MDAFLTNTQVKKLGLLKYLSFDSSVTTKNLATVWSVSTKSINRYCDSLQEDFDYYIPKIHVSLKNKQGQISLLLPKDVSYNYLKDSLTLAYIQESIKINIIDALLTKPFKNVIDLSEFLHLTPTTIYTHLYQLEELLDTFEMSFKWTKQTKGFNFVYEEKKIRYFAYLFYWKFFKGKSPIIQNKTFDYQSQLNSVKTIVRNNTSELTLHQFCYIAQVTSWYSQQNVPVTLKPDSLETLRIMAEVIDYSEVLIDDSNSLHETDRLFFNLHLQIAVSSLDDNNIREKKVHLLEEKNSYLYNYCQTLYQQLCSQFKLSPTKMDRIHFIYNMVYFSLYNNELGIPVNNPFINDFNLVFHTTNQLLDDQMLPLINNIFNKVAKEYNQVIKNEKLAQLVMGLFINKNKNKSSITLFINFSSNPMGNATIKSQLLQVFNPDKLNFSTDITTADLIISDNALLYEGQLPVFFMENLNDPLYWSKLFEVVQEKLVKLIFDFEQR